MSGDQATLHQHVCDYIADVICTHSLQMACTHTEGEGVGKRGREGGRERGGEGSSGREQWFIQNILLEGGIVVICIYPHFT